MMNIKSGKYNSEILVSQGRSLTLAKGTGVGLTICSWSNKILNKEYAWAPKTYNFQWTWMTWLVCQITYQPLWQENTRACNKTKLSIRQSPTVTSRILIKNSLLLHWKRRLGRYSALNLVCPRYNRESEGGRTFSVSATRLWNSLPINLKKGTCVTSFRKAIYSHFF